MSNHQRHDMTAFFEYSKNTELRTRADCGHLEQQGKLVRSACGTLLCAVCASMMFDNNESPKEKAVTAAKAQGSGEVGSDDDKPVMHSEQDPINEALKTLGERMDNGQKEIELAKKAHADMITSLTRKVAEHLSNHPSNDIDEALVIALIKKHSGGGGKRTLKIKTATETRTMSGTQHVQFTTLLKACAATQPDGHRLNIWLKGPAGSGKTTAARNVAEALGLPFFFNGALDNEYKLKGFIDAQSRIISPPFRKAWTDGGVYLFDEVDASLPSAVLGFNGALANGSCDFPDANVPRHKDCVIIAAANTFGSGATAEYVGRAKQDAAFVDRFIVIDWTVDEKLERSLCSITSWCSYVQVVRASVAAKAIKGVIISPRASLFGAALLESGLNATDVVGMTVRKGMSDEQWKAIGSPVYCGDKS